MAVRGAVLYKNANVPPISSYSIDGGTPSIYIPRVSENNTIPTTFFVSPQLSDGDHTLSIDVLSDGPSFFLDYILFNATSVAATNNSNGPQPTLVKTAIAAPTGAPDDSDSASSSKSIGPIVGGVVGGVALLVAAILAFYFFYWDRRGRRPYNYHATALNEDGKSHPIFHLFFSTIVFGNLNTRS